MQYRHGIDGLRAVAVLAVMFFHADFAFFPGGYLGVDIFFVISGFLITGLIIEGLEGGTFSFRAFYERRIRRIFPALFFVITVSAVMAYFLLVPSRFEDFGKSLVAVPLFVSNVYFWRNTGYFSGNIDEKPLVHTWSISIEEQFYIGFPLVVFLLWKWGRQPTLVCLVFLAIASLAFSEILSRLNPEANYYLLPSRIWELLSGAICAFLIRRYQIKPNGLVSGLALSAIIVSLMVFSEATRSPSLLTVLPVLACALVLLFAKGTAVEGLLSLPVLKMAGLLSYSAYLWHQPIYAFARISSPTQLPPLIFIGLILSCFGLAFLTWRYIEKPFRARTDERYTILPNRWGVFGAWAMGSIVLVAVGLHLYFTAGLPSRYTLNDTQKRYIETAIRTPDERRCDAQSTPPITKAGVCHYGGPQIATAVVGDSHARELAYSLADKLEPIGQGVAHRTMSLCMLTHRTQHQTPAPCPMISEDFFNKILSDPTLKNVVISYRINSYMFGNHDGVYPNLPEKKSDAEKARVLSAIKGAVSEWAALEKNVIFVLQTPELPGSVEDLVFANQAGESELRGVPVNWWRTRSAFAHSEIRNISGIGKIIDPALIFCGKAYCAAGRNGVSFYFDDNHLSPSGAGKVADMILPLLRVEP